MPRHIELRRQCWYAVLNVPAKVQAKVGRKRFRVSLKTSDKKVAEREAKIYIVDWQRQIDAARGEAIAQAKPNALQYDPAYWRDALRWARTPGDRAAIEEQIDMVAWEIGATNVDNIGDPPSTNPEAVQFYFEATGDRVATMEYLDEWIKSQQVKAKTAKMRRATIERLGAKFRMLSDVTRKEARRWVTELIAELKPATVQRMLSDCRIYWKYLATIEAVPEDSAPFDRLGLKVEKSSWLPFEPADVLKLSREAIVRGDAQLSDLIRLAMYSGARREELCSLKVAHVRHDRFEIVDAKTAAGIRTVPIHPELAQTIARLIADSKDGYVLSGLTVTKYGNRGDALGKRFTRLKRELGFGARHVFHSLRGTVITMLERANVPEGTVQDIVGHERSTLTGSTYSGKTTFEMRRDALAKLIY
ncbi:MAG: tyrosine-type recombinase/integrase [Alphaproteobacteria bacterium]